MPYSLTTLKDRATQLLIKYKSGALVTQFGNFNVFMEIWRLMIKGFLNNVRKTAMLVEEGIPMRDR